MRSKPPAVSKLALLALPVLLVCTSCATDNESIRSDAPAVIEEEPPILMKRTGIPILMDVPILGFFFSRTTIVR